MTGNDFETERQSVFFKDVLAHARLWGTWGIDAGFPVAILSRLH